MPDITQLAELEKARAEIKKLQTEVAELHAGYDNCMKLATTYRSQLELSNTEIGTLQESIKMLQYSNRTVNALWGESHKEAKRLKAQLTVFNIQRDGDYYAEPLPAYAKVDKLRAAYETTIRFIADKGLWLAYEEYKKTEMLHSSSRKTSNHADTNPIEDQLFLEYRPSR